MTGRADIAIREIPPSGPLYEAERRVRGKVLREPMGMGPTVEVFPFERESRHFVALAGDEVVGCLLFHPRGDGGRIYQMAVLEAYRGRGIGARLMAFVEEAARRAGTRRVHLHARHYVVAFYQSLGYRCDGAPFLEIGLEHQRMVKSLEAQS